MRTGEGSLQTSIRIENTADFGIIRDILLTSFPSSGEADLVEALRQAGDAAFALVAEAGGGEIVGHLVLSRMSAPFAALGLGPVAVSPQWRRQGIADRLIRHGLQLAKANGWQAVFVLGEPAYYQRFGFSATLAKGFQSPYAGPYLMACALADDLPATSGRIDYAPAFNALG